MFKIIKTVPVFLAGVLLGGALVAWAFNNPTQDPPGGSGILSVVNSNVGIGVANPSAKLQVGVSSSVDPFLVQNPSGNPSLVVKNSGSVDINNPTTNSAYKLNVNGDTNIIGKITASQFCLGISNCLNSWSSFGLLEVKDTVDTPNDGNTAIATCPSPKKITGGGCYNLNGASCRLLDSAPYTVNTAWDSWYCYWPSCGYNNRHAYAICQ